MAGDRYYVNVQLGLSPAESADRLADAFAAISQEFQPIQLDCLPPRTQALVLARRASEVPYISRQMVEAKIKQANNTKGGVSGDLPVKLAKEFGPELARPVAQIFREISKSGEWPSRLKLEQGIPLKKSQNPQSESEIRIISLTQLLSKVFEKIVADWLLKYISDKLDANQYGGRKGSSTSHGWLLQIVMGFLKGRKLVVTYRGVQSGVKEMPGGGPQGTILGMLLFLVLINSAGFAHEDRAIGSRVAKATNVRKAISNIHLKFVDDLTIAESLKLKDVLSVQEQELQRPLQYHERFEQTLDPVKSQVQVQLNELSKHADTNKMRINHSKTKVMLFNSAKKFDFQPNLVIDEVNLEVVEQMKLLGVVITSDLKWDKNTDYITKKAFSRLWLLRRLKKLGASRAALLDIYVKNVRSVVEYSSVVWGSSLTLKNTAQIERVQKAVFAIVLGKQYVTYPEACAELKMETLSQRRLQLARKFALKTSKHPIHKNWFEPNLPQKVTRQTQLKFKPPQARTERFLKSAIPFLTNLLNEVT